MTYNISKLLTDCIIDPSFTKINGLSVSHEQINNWK